MHAQVQEAWAHSYNGGPFDTAVAMAVDGWGDISVTGHSINTTYQWRFNGKLINGATGPQLHLTNVPLAAAGDYSVIVSNSAAYTISPEARLVLHVPATVTSRGQTNTVLVGESITFTVTTIGEGPLSFQWMFDGEVIPDATSATLVLSNLQEASFGLYTAVVSNAYGMAVSQPYKLTVVPGSLGLTLRGAWPGYARRPFYDVAVVSNRAYVTMGGEGLTIFDISNPAVPVRLGSHPTLGDAGTVSVQGDYAYVIEERRWTGSNFLGSVEIFDVSDPASPWLLGSFDSSGYAGFGNNNVAVAGQYAYVADGSAGVQVVDVTLPWQPVRVGGYIANDGFASRVQVVGNHAFVAYGLAGLHILDLSDPVHPKRIGAYAACGGQFRDVAVAGNYAYAADPINGLVIIDVSNPANPIRAGANGQPLGAENVRVAGNRLYALGNYWAGNHYVAELMVFDLTDPADPVRIGRTEVETYSSSASLDVAGTHAFVASRYTGLQVIDLSNPADPVPVNGSETFGFARAVRVVGNRAYLADGFGGLQILDVSNPANLLRVGGYDTGWALDIDVAGNRAYIADANAGLAIADISDPSRPIQIGRFDTGSDGEQSAIQIVNQLAYLVDGSGDLRILNISNPANPVSVGMYAVTNGRAYGVHVAGNRAYLVGTRPLNEDDNIGFLLILDVTQPASPVRIGQTDTATIGHSIALKGQWAFIAGEYVSLTIVDVSNPANPLPVGRYGDRSSEAVQVVGDYAYLAGQHIGVMVLDVTEPAFPYRLAHYPFDNFHDEDEGCDIQVVGNLAYVTRGAHGLLVFEITGLPRINSVTHVGGNVVLSWSGSPGLKLQRCTSLADASWTDVPGSEGQSQATLSMGGANQFFRLMKP